MPSFVCDTCQETLKKAKLDDHARRCRYATFSCIDCYRSFSSAEDYRAHTSCITEVQKYEKKGPPSAFSIGSGKREAKAKQPEAVLSEPEKPRRAEQQPLQTSARPTAKHASAKKDKQRHKKERAEKKEAKRHRSA